MNRPKKIKLEANIHSGNYMTSSIHDQNDDEEMPIASPDATNEVPLNDLDQVDGLEIGKEASGPGEAGPGGVKGKDADKMMLGPETIASSSKLTASLAGNEASISGGLTLNRQNASLKNLISYIRSAYSNNLTSPKWKNFKGLKLQVMEKIRLNNVIWRTWFEQCKNSELSTVCVCVLGCGHYCLSFCSRWTQERSKTQKTAHLSVCHFAR